MRLIVLLVSLLTLVYTEEDMFPVVKKGGRKHYCGNELRFSLMLLCDSIYKRSSSPDSASAGSEDWSMNYIALDEPQQPQPQSMFPFRPRARALAVIPEYFRRHSRGGVADECCSKPCTIAELSSYCGKKP